MLVRPPATMHDRGPKTANATNMFPAQLIAALLIVTTPAILIFDGPIIHGLVIAATAISVALVAVRIRPGEADFLSSVIRPMAVVAAIPALWMVIQVLPLKTIGLANPVWESAALALGRPLAGSISIDPGMTLALFGQVPFGNWNSICRGSGSNRSPSRRVDFFRAHRRDDHNCSDGLDSPSQRFHTIEK